jgi:hypothetical protein
MRRLALILLSGLVIVAAPAEDLAWPLGDGWRLTLESDGDDPVYPRYLADPRRPQVSVAMFHADGTGIPDSGGTRFALDLGVRVPVARIESTDGRRRGQFYAEAGWFGQFDTANSLDEIGWDGWYALYGGLDIGGPWRFRLGTRHLSGHIGDELVLRSGRERINYTRDENMVGIAWVREGVSAYVDYGRLFRTSFPGQGAGQLQAGVQVERPRRWGPLGWYAGVDAKMFEEDDWEPGVAVEVGLTAPIDDGDTVWRLAVTGYSGRAVLGEFSRHHENFVALTLGIDF